jgi:hypothetical protein
MEIIMLYFVLAASISYGLAYLISSTGLEYWRSAVGMLSGCILGFLGSTAIVALIATTLDASLGVKALGQVIILSILLSVYGVYRARVQLKTGKPALPFKIPNWVTYVAGAVFLIGVIAAIAIPSYRNTEKFDSSSAKLPDTTQASTGTDWANGTITPPTQPSTAPQNSQIDAFLNQQPKANPFDQFDEKPSQSLAPEHLAKRKIILEKIRLKELSEINGASTTVMPQNVASWSTSNILDLERNQTPWRNSKTQFLTHVVNNTSNNLSVIGFDFKESACSDNMKSNRFFVTLERPISSGSVAVVNFMIPESLVSSRGNFCLDIVSAWN